MNKNNNYNNNKKSFPTRFLGHPQGVIVVVFTFVGLLNVSGTKQKKKETNEKMCE